MQTFDQELEKLILAGVVDRELALSYATNRTNLQLRLDTLGTGAAKTESIPLRPREDLRRAGAPRPGRGAPAPARDGEAGLDDLIER